MRGLLRNYRNGNAKKVGGNYQIGFLFKLQNRFVS